MVQEKTPLVAIVGETASGKSALALDIAKRLNGEIICADSRTVYKGMDIGTAKPSKAEQTEVPHHLLDVIAPDEKFSVADFKLAANKLIEDITNRGKLPIMVGGTGLYIDSVLFDYALQPDSTERDELNPRHAKKSETSQVRSAIRANTLVLGLNIEKEVLEKRIEARVNKMIEQGLETEVSELVNRYGWQEALTGVGYQEWQAYYEGNQTLEETKDLITIHTRQYAKRQRTWFKRNPDINWFQDAASALTYAENWLIENKSTGHAMRTNTAP